MIHSPGRFLVMAGLFLQVPGPLSLAPLFDYRMFDIIDK